MCRIIARKKTEDGEKQRDGRNFRLVRKIAKSDYSLHVRLLVRIEHLGYHEIDFHEI